MEIAEQEIEKRYDALSIERIVINTSREFRTSLDMHEFWRCAVIVGSEEKSGNILKKYFLSKNPKNKIWAEYITGQYHRVARDIKNRQSDLLNIHLFIIIVTAFERFLRDHIFVLSVLKNFPGKVEIKNSIQTFIDKDRLAKINKLALEMWDNHKNNRDVLIRELVGKSIEIYPRFFKDFKVDWYNLENTLADLNTKKKQTKSNIEFNVYSGIEKSLRNENSRKFLNDEDFDMARDIFLLRNSIIHNRSKNKEQLNIGPKKFLAGKIIEFETADAGLVVKTLDKFTHHFPDHILEDFFE